MGRAARSKWDRRNRRAQLGVDQIDLRADLKRSLIREFDKAPLINEIRRELGQFSRWSSLEACAASGDRIPPLVLGRLVREIAASTQTGSRNMSLGQLMRLAKKMQQVLDPVVIDFIGQGRLHDVMITRFLTDNLPFHSNHRLAVHRTLNVMLDSNGPSLLDAEHWKQRLGLPLSNLMIGSMYFLNQAAQGTFDVTRFRSQPSIPDVDAIVEGTLNALSCTLADLHHSAHIPEDDLYDLGPLASKPLIWIDEHQVVVPSPAHISIATSSTALYIRLIREDAAEKSRERSRLVGERFEQHLFEYASTSLRPDWTVRRLDQEPAPGGKIADIVLWPPDRSFVVIIETKVSLSLTQAQLGDHDKRNEAHKLYQKSFDQIGNSVRSIGRNGFLSGAPTDVPVFGLAVTLDNHLTSVVDDCTYFGLVLDYQPPGDPGAFCDVARCRVVNADNAEEFIDALAILNPAEALALSEKVVAGPSSLTAVPAAINELGFRERLGAAAVNPAVLTTLSHLCDEIMDPTFRAAIRSIIDSV